MEKGLSYKNCSYRRKNISRKHTPGHEGEGRKSPNLFHLSPSNFLLVTRFGQAQLKAERQDDSGPRVNLWVKSAGRADMGREWVDLGRTVAKGMNTWLTFLVGSLRSNCVFLSSGAPHLAVLSEWHLLNNH